MGFLQRLFGLKEQDSNTVQAKESKEAYFLDADSAKTFGDINYMRQPKAVERTFPKVEGMNYGGRRKISQFSSEGAAVVYDGDGKPTNTASSSSASSESAPMSTPIRSSSAADKSLDFRSMARDIKR
ncbi:MAG: hypothetical protein EAZ61_02710 [Oscillatoriales cyanobacterium]|jgi:hypothetical protein|nr:MAG: hypothetical protein EAZ61_02710 [Oscillatoriales cyanobacterium]